MEYYIGSIVPFAFNWAPASFAECNGAMIPITQNQALYSLISNTFGGSASQNTFGMPDLRGRVLCGAGQGPGTANRPYAQPFGADKAALTTNNLTTHTHTVQEKTAGQTVTASATATVNANSNVTPDKNKPQASYWAKYVSGTTVTPIYSSTHDSTMAADAVQVSVTPSFNANNLNIGLTGTGLPFDIAQPSLALLYAICTQGLYPTRP